MDDTHEYDHYLAEVAIRNGDMAYARELLREIVANRPNADAWYLFALTALTPAQRRERLQRALALNPHHARAHAALSQMQHEAEPPKPGLIRRLIYKYLYNK